MEEDCYFEVIDDDGKQRMSAKCIDCCKGKEENKFFWQGSRRGCGQYKVVCESCKKVIYDPNK